MKDSYIKAPREKIDYVLQLLSSVYPLGKEVSDTFYEHVISRELAKDEYLLHQGDYSYYMYFILKGALMSYSKHNEKKITTYISIENEFVSSISGLFGTRPSQEAVVAVEPTILIGVHTDILQKMFETSFEMNFVFRRMVEQYYRDAQERSYIVRLGNARERYLYFTQSKPGYVERLPAEYVASLLDMKPETLLRIQKQQQQEEQKAQDSKMLCRMLEDYITSNESFKDRAITLAKLAQALKISVHKLSWLLNTVYGENFKNFINNYRIEYIKQSLQKQEDWYSYTIDAVATNAGFSSRSTFYTAFRKQVGMTPLEYVKTSEIEVPVDN